MDTAKTAEATPPKETEGIALETPIVRGETSITHVSLRRPDAGAMRGLQIQPLMQGDVNSILALLPRITTPPLTGPELEKLDPVDLGALAGEITGFFMSRETQAILAKVMGAADQEISTG